MITIRPLQSNQQIDDACALLHDTYIQRQNWAFAPDNPSKVRVEEKDGRMLLLDRYTYLAIWFGAFDQDTLVGCIRLLGPNDDDQLETETYPSSAESLAFLKNYDKQRCYEIQKLATRIDYVGRGIVKRLMLVCFQYCDERKWHVLAVTSNMFLKSMFKKIALPLICDGGFRYEPNDPSLVNVYFGDWDKSEVTRSRSRLDYLENDISNDQRTIFRALQMIVHVLPTPFYWMNTDGVVLGINDLCLKAIGTTREIVGKRPYDFYSKEIAEHILQHNAEVVRREEILSQDEWIEDITTKKRKCFSSIKAPLYDAQGIIVGIVGTSIEVTAEKEAEQLRIENGIYRTAAFEQGKFRKIADQVAHDIRSPLSSMLMMLQFGESIPERERTTLRRAATTINDITNNLLVAVADKSTLPDQPDSLEQFDPLLISPPLLELLAAKKYEFRKLPIRFEHDFSQTGNFAWVRIGTTSFKRMVSNLINNAVEAIGETGEIRIELEADDDKVTIAIIDNGKGMRPELVTQIRNQVAFSEGKEHGHAIGLAQVYHVLKQSQGLLSVESTVGVGTTMQLTFPRATADKWIAEKIELRVNDVIVVLDDDESIHAAWDSRFEPLRQQYNTLEICHFQNGQSTIDFINKLPDHRKSSVFLLTDYELQNQELNGLDVIHQSQAQRSVLVTSHFANASLRNYAAKACTTVLPKQLAYDVPIHVVVAPAN